MLSCCVKVAVLQVIQGLNCNLQTVTGCCNAAFGFLSKEAQWCYYFPFKDEGKLRGRQKRGDTREKPQVTLETGAPGIPVVSEEGLNTTPPLFTALKGHLLLPESWTQLVQLSDLQQVITTMRYCASVMAVMWTQRRGPVVAMHRRAQIVTLTPPVVNGDCERELS